MEENHYHRHQDHIALHLRTQFCALEPILEEFQAPGKSITGVMMIRKFRCFQIAWPPVLRTIMPRYNTFAALRRVLSSAFFGTSRYSLARATSCKSYYCCECSCSKKIVLDNMQFFGPLGPLSLTNPWAQAAITGYAASTHINFAANPACKLMAMFHEPL